MVCKCCRVRKSVYEQDLLLREAGRHISPCRRVYWLEHAAIAFQYKFRLSAQWPAIEVPMACGLWHMIQAKNRHLATRERIIVPSAKGTKCDQPFLECCHSVSVRYGCLWLWRKHDFWLAKSNSVLSSSWTSLIWPSLWRHSWKAATILNYNSH